MEKIFNYILYFFLFFLLIIISLICPQTAFESTSSSLSMFLNVILPSLFPFMIIMDLLLKSKMLMLISYLFDGITKPLFNLPGVASIPILTGFLSGYPGGAIITANLREKKLITKLEAERLIAFCNNSSPIFITGAIGVSLLQNPSLGLVILKSHIISALIIGILISRGLIIKRKKRGQVRTFNNWGQVRTFKNHNHQKHKRNQKKPLDFKTQEEDNRITFTDLSTSILKSAKTLVLICGYVVLFGVLIGIFQHFEVLTLISIPFERFISPEILSTLLTGLIELTTGIKEIIIQKPPLPVLMALISLMVSWGSLSIHFQTISILQKTDIRYNVYLVGKFFHGILSALLTLLFLYF